MTQRVYVGAGVLPTDYDPSGPGARAGLLGPVLVLVMAV